MSRTISVSVAREFSVSAERVFDAFLDEAAIGRWMFGPEIRDEQIVHVRIEPRVGGTFSFAVRRGDDLVDHVGEYLEIDRPRRLVFSWGIAGESEDESRVIVDIIAKPPGCRLVLTHEMDAKWSDYADSARNAWTRMLDFLARHLEAQD